MTLETPIAVTARSGPRGAGGPVGRVATYRWLWLPLVIYTVTRVVGAFVISWVSRSQGGTAGLAKTDPLEGYFVHTVLPADPGYLGVATNWDGQWYEYIAVDGYQPAGADQSAAAGWAWAFPPGYPKSVSVVMDVTGWSFPVVAVALSLIAGAIAMVLLYRLAEPHVGMIGAAGVVALTCCFPSAPLVQVAYSESFGLLLVIWSLSALSKRRYWWAVVPVVLLAFTRLITPPLAFVAVFHVWVRRRRLGESLTRSEWLALTVYVVVALTGVAYWSAISGALGGGTGASRAGDQASRFGLGWFSASFDAAPYMLLLPVFLAVLVCRIALSEWRTWGPEMSAWAAAYPCYLLLVTPPTTGLVRYLLLAFPLALGLVGREGQSTRRRVTIISVGCALLMLAQVAWLRLFFVVASRDLSVLFMP